MIEAYGNIWDNASKYDAVVITTNGYVKKNGEAVMGRGIALEAAKIFPELPKWLGRANKKWGNMVHMNSFDYWCGDAPCDQVIFSFPVKPEYGPNGEMGWKVKADIKLIKQSASELSYFVDELKYSKILMPRPGCGNGGLRWEDVKPVIEPILDDRFTVMEKYG